MSEYGSISDSFRDIETSRQMNMCGYHANGYGGDSSSGKTTTGIQAAVTFLNAGRDFVEETGNVTEDIRWILEGRDYTRLCLESLNDY